MCHDMWGYEPLREEEWLDTPEEEDEEPLETAEETPEEPILIADD